MLALVAEAPHLAGLLGLAGVLIALAVLFE